MEEKPVKLAEEALPGFSGYDGDWRTAGFPFSLFFRSWLQCGGISDILNSLLEEYVQPLNGIDSKFRLAILVARRAKQLIGGARKKIDFKSDNPLTVAMEEFRQGKIDFDVLNENEVESFFGSEPVNPEGTLITDESTLEGEEAAGEPLDGAEDSEEAEEEEEEELEPESES